MNVSHSRMRETAMQYDSTVESSCAARLRFFTRVGTTRAHSAFASFGSHAGAGGGLSNAPGRAWISGFRPFILSLQICSEARTFIQPVFERPPRVARKGKRGEG